MKINKKNIVPVALAVIIYLASYYIPKILVSPDRLHFVKFAIDDLIPLFSPSVIVYAGAFIQWVIAIILMLYFDEDEMHKYSSAIIYGSLFCLVVFMVYPTGIIRIDIEVNNIFDWMLKLVYSNDSIINALPSMHCFVSTIVVYIYRNSKVISRNAYMLSSIFSVLVFMSTLLTKQHFIIDVPTGILLGIATIHIAEKYPLTRLFNKINNLVK